MKTNEVTSTKFKFRKVCILCKHYKYDEQMGSVYCEPYGMSLDWGPQAGITHTNWGCSLHEFKDEALEMSEEFGIEE